MSGFMWNWKQSLVYLSIRSQRQLGERDEELRNHKWSEVARETLLQVLNGMMFLGHEISYKIVHLIVVDI